MILKIIVFKKGIEKKYFSLCIFCFLSFCYPVLIIEGQISRFWHWRKAQLNEVNFLWIYGFNGFDAGYFNFVFNYTSSSSRIKISEL